MTDLVRDYRICAYHLQPGLGHHVHFPLDSKDRIPIEIGNEQDAATIARLYANEYVSFELRAFEEVVKRWKSGSKRA